MLHATIERRGQVTKEYLRGPCCFDMTYVKAHATSKIMPNESELNPDHLAVLSHRTYSKTVRIFPSTTKQH